MNFDTKLLFSLGIVMILSGIAGMVRDSLRDVSDRIDHIASYGEEEV